MLISIIVPVYNVETYLRRCVDSLLCQTYSNIEIILVDDGSTDKSGSICDEYLYVDKRIRVIHKKNGGLSSARNAGLEIADGEYIGFLDSDDWARPEMLEFLLSIITEEDSEIAQCGLTLFYEDQKVSEYVKKDVIREPTVHLSYIEAYNQLYGIDVNRGINFLTWNKLYKRSLFDSLRFYEGKNNEDIIMTSKILILCSKISISNTPMVYYMQRKNSIMGDQKNNKYKMLNSHCYAYLDVYDYYVEKHIEQRSGIINYINGIACSLIKLGITDKSHRKDIKNVLLDVRARKIESEKSISVWNKIIFTILRLVN